jgi:uncharacterized protein
MSALVLVTLVIASFIWFGRHAFPGATVVFSLVLVALFAWSHRQRGESARDLGFRLDTAPRAALLLVPIGIMAIALTLFAGWAAQSLRFPAAPDALNMLAKLLLFGIAQQYVLLGFYYRGIARLVPAPTGALLLTALVFAAFHLPNPFLCCVTLFAAMIAVMVYRRAPNLWLIGVVHGVISFCLYYALPVEWTGGLRVGPEYWGMRP